mmetsp:Transcript_20023/g.65062  ORF Transcript_20023/g.65062 Transcript_20023/m.65062 type:complete len:249 (-) Transcript_20023:1704-2450(-)
MASAPLSPPAIWRIMALCLSAASASAAALDWALFRYMSTREARSKPCRPMRKSRSCVSDGSARGSTSAGATSAKAPCEGLAASGTADEGSPECRAGCPSPASPSPPDVARFNCEDLELRSSSGPPSSRSLDTVCARAGGRRTTRTGPTGAARKMSKAVSKLSGLMACTALRAPMDFPSTAMTTSFKWKRPHRSAAPPGLMRSTTLLGVRPSPSPCWSRRMTACSTCSLALGLSTGWSAGKRRIVMPMT